MGIFDRLQRPRTQIPITLDNQQVLESPAIPPTFVFTERREPSTQGPTWLMAPWDNYETFYDLNIGWHEAPDPIRQSDFWAAGNKIHPAAQMPIVTNLAIGSREAVMENTYHVGKLLGYIHRPMYAGGQSPSTIRANIQEAMPATYGSQYEVQGTQPGGQVTTATGFSEYPIASHDGDPYWG